VAGDDPGFIGEDKQAVVDGLDDLSGVATWEVGSANASCKKGVAGEDEIQRGEVKADAALGVTWGVDDLGREVFEADFEAFIEARVGGFGFRGFDAEPTGLLVHHFEQGQVVFIQQDGRAGEALEAERASDMVNMGVGDENLLDFQLVLGETAEDACDFVAWVDDDRFAGAGIPKDGAVALEGADGEGFDDHEFILVLGFGAMSRRSVARAAHKPKKPRHGTSHGFSLFYSQPRLPIGHSIRGRPVTGFSMGLG